MARTNLNLALLFTGAVLLLLRAGVVAFEVDESNQAASAAPARQLNDLLPSLYLDYENVPAAAKKSWFSTVDVKDSALATFFAVQRTQFGYLGIQQTRTFMGSIAGWLRTELNDDISPTWHGLVIFSAWNTEGSTCQVEAVGAGAFEDDFGGEGTGCQIKYDTKWGAGDYNFVTTTETLANGRLQLSGYWQYPQESQDWLLVGSISVLPEGRKFGDGGIASFIEQYEKSREGNDLRMSDYGPLFVEMSSGSSWEPIDVAKFSVTSTDKTAYYVGATTGDSSLFTMGLSGTGTSGIGANTPDDTVLTLRNPIRSSSALQGWIAARDSGTLPQGCVGKSSCPSTTGGGLTTSAPWSSISNLSQWLLLLLTLLFGGSLVFTLIHCFCPSTKGDYESGDPSMRQVMRLDTA